MNRDIVSDWADDLEEDESAFLPIFTLGLMFIFSDLRATIPDFDGVIRHKLWDSHHSRSILDTA
jgi:hypothetical protein